MFSKSQIATENSNLLSNCLKYQYYHVPSRPFQGCSTRTAQGCFPEVKQQNLCIKHFTENNHIFQRNLYLYHILIVTLHPFSILGSLLLLHLSERSPFRCDTAQNNLSDPFKYFNSSSHEPFCCEIIYTSNLKMVHSFERSVSTLTIIGGPFLLLLLSIETVCNDLL